MASPNRYFTENSRSVPLPKALSSMTFFVRAQPVFLHRKGEGSFLLSEFECPRTILIEQQQEHHIFFMDVPPPLPPPRTRRCSRAIFFLILLICVNDINCIDYYYLFKNKIWKKKCYPRPSTWYPRPRHGTLDPRQKDRLARKRLNTIVLIKFDKV